MHKSIRLVQAHPPIVMVLVAAIMIGACRSSAPLPATQVSANLTPPASASNTAPAPTEAVSADVTAWDQVVSQIQPDGTVTADTALQAFALAVVPLPGVTPPAGQAGDLNADLAVAWVNQVWAQLSVDQQAAITAALEPMQDPYRADADTPASAPGLRMAAWPPAAVAADPNCGEFAADPAVSPAGIPMFLQPYASMVRKAYGAFARHLHRQAVPKLAVCLLPGVTLADHSMTYVFDAEHMQLGLPASCTIFLNADWVGASPDAGFLSLVISLATFVCFSYTADPDETISARQMRVTPAWVRGGATFWASATVATETFGSLDSRLLHGPWSGYLEEPHRSLFLRAESAIGFFAQVDSDQAGPGAWDVLDKTFKAEYIIDAFEAATGLRQSFIDIWAAGYFRVANLGPDWNIVGPGITADKSADAEIEVANGQSDYLPAPALAVAIARLTIKSDVTLLSGEHLRIHDGVQDLKEIDSKTYCTKPGGVNACICPKDTPGAKLPPLPSLGRDVKLALTGMEYGARATIQGLSLEDYCGKPPTPQPDGTWSMVFWSPDLGDAAPPLMVAYACGGLRSTWKAIYLPSQAGTTVTFELPFTDDLVAHLDIHRDIPPAGQSAASTLDYALDFTLDPSADPPVIIVTGTKTETQGGHVWVFPPREFGSDAPLELKNVSLETQLEPYPDYQHPFRAQALEECGP
jgi:hypothetical protein